jgi:hypothetical protein
MMLMPLLPSLLLLHLSNHLIASMVVGIEGISK